MDAETLYRELEGNAWKLAAKCMLDVDDIKQELYLLCMDVASGRSTYSGLVGDVHGYIMGWLWKYILRWAHSNSLDHLMKSDVMDEDWCTQHLPANHDSLSALHVPSVEDVILQRDEMQEQHVQDMARVLEMRSQARNQSILVALVQNGYWSTRDAAKFCGVSQTAIQKQIKARSQSCTRA